MGKNDERKMFPVTRWTKIFRVKDSPEDESEGEINELCELYWRPVYSYARHRGYGIEDAEEITNTVLAGVPFKRADPESGKLRNLLKTEVIRKISNRERHRNAKKREPKKGRVELSEDTAESSHCPQSDPSESPDRAYDQNWALVTFSCAIEQLHQSDPEKFDALKGSLTGGKIDYQQIQDELDVSEAYARTLVFRFRKKLLELFTAEIERTAPTADVDEELVYLRTLLGELTFFGDAN